MALHNIPLLNLLVGERPLRRRIITLILITLAVVIVAIFLQISSATALERVQKRGYIEMVTRNGPTTFYEGPRGKTGFEYDLAQLFADELDVELKVKVPESFSEVLPRVSTGLSGDFAAAGISVTEKRRELVEFGPSYLEITPQLIYNAKANKRPKKIVDTKGKKLGVIAGSSHEETLVRLKEELPEIQWIADPNISVSELIQQVNRGELDFAIADSNEVKVSRRFMPELRVAFDLGLTETIAWAFPKTEDASLRNAAFQFFKKIEENGQLTQLVERHFGHIKRFDYVDKRTFLRHIENRLPLYELSFRQASEKTDVDWRLLAAVGYQESHWDPNATSPTGVRGLMMLTQRTAAQLKVKNRLDPRQSIFGGAEYLRQQFARIPARIPEPDRIWMGLAAYNVGFGHLEDARVLAQKQGKDPDKWVDVKATLPLLSKRKYYKQTKYGYARGSEPVHYVQNIRDYYEILVWYSERETDQDSSRPATPVEPDIKAPSAL